jgi:hypothetical protein
MASSTPLPLGTVARRFNLPLWKIRRIYQRGLLPEPERVGNYRVVRETDLPKVERALIAASYLPEGEPAHVA